MRRLFLAILLAAGCIHGSPASQRDSGAMRAIVQQERWAQDAPARRPNRADLRPGLEAVRKAQASEDRLVRLPPRAGGVRLAPAPLPLPRPFLGSAARLVSANPELARELDRLPPDDAAQIRARLPDIDREKEEAKRAEPAATAPPPAVAEQAAPPEPREAEAPSPTLTVANDAKALLAKRTPRSITLREDGLFELSYDDADYLVDPQGKLVRKEAPAQK